MCRYFYCFVVWCALVLSSPIIAQIQLSQSVLNNTLHGDSIANLVNSFQVVFDSTGYLRLSALDSVILNNPFIQLNSNLDTTWDEDTTGEKRAKIDYIKDVFYKGITGKGKLLILIDRKGNPIKILVEYSSSEKLTQVVAQAVRNSRFSVLLKNQIPTMRWISLPFGFMVK